MNQRRVVGILQELAEAHARIGALQAELAEAMAEEPAPKTRKRRLREPKSQPSEAAVRDMERKLHSLGFKT